MSAKIGFLWHFFIDKTSLGLSGGELIAKLVRGNVNPFWSFHFFLQIAVLKENMTKFTYIL